MIRAKALPEVSDSAIARVLMNSTVRKQKDYPLLAEKYGKSDDEADHDPYRVTTQEDVDKLHRCKHVVSAAARELAAKPELDPTDDKMFAELLSMQQLIEWGIDRARNQVRAEKVGDQHFGKRDRAGATLWALKPGEKVADYVGHGGGQLRDAGFGDVIRAQMFGAGRDAAQIRATLAGGTDSSGGFLVPDVLSGRLIDRLRAALVIMRAGAITVPITSDNLRIAKIATDPTPAWRAENAAVAESVPSLEAVNFVPRSLGLIVKSSRELAEDAPNFAEMVETTIANAFAGEVDRVALVGTGTAPQPRGIVNVAGIGAVSMGTNGAALANYTRLLDALQTYETANNAVAPSAAILHPRTMRAVRGMADSTGQPLRRPEGVDFPMLSTTSMPITETQGTANNASSIVLGDFSQLMIGVRTTLQVYPLQQAFASTAQIGFLCLLRVDVQVAQPTSFVRIAGIIP